ncbi:MAG: glycosyltransferase family 1 protein [Bryobacteraceae bacterium]|jgi:glycosyltransferase involved in cell wall biosynthesis
MRVCIDATPLLLRSAGVKNYIYHWLVALKGQARRGESVCTFPFVAPPRELDHEHSMVGPMHTASALCLLHGLNVSGLPWTAPGVDVFHASHHMRNPPRRTRLTSTVHDMTCWLTPEFHAPANVAVTRWFGEHIMKRADGIIAVSENTRRDVLRILDLEPARVQVIHPGVPDAYFDVTAAEVHAVRQALGLARPYVLFVGTIEPRKNVPGLLDAWAELSPDCREEYELVIAGPAGWAERGTLQRLRAATSGVRYLGYLEEARLPGLTAGAALLAYPSFYEGFGLPVAQAMAAGVPVLTSNLSSLPEVAGDAALLVDPNSTAEIRGALEKLLTSPSLRERLGGAGRRRAREFHWDAVARESLAWLRGIAQ